MNTARTMKLRRTGSRCLGGAVAPVNFGNLPASNGDGSGHRWVGGPNDIITGCQGKKEGGKDGASIHAPFQDCRVNPASIPFLAAYLDFLPAQVFTRIDNQRSNVLAN